ncbi:hypothetical protein BDZ85DRAFT_120202 [Elsinoe ampelina]|uniref:Uncharacterized protein n=1 Tax=Elsinoe ampelina TaxID=302913 RepID=A0A6A6GB99_9PEZI|nr:hypothetical protein BDZ85DRAFT_120202 [Elsinoe ampelina]
MLVTIQSIFHELPLAAHRASLFSPKGELYRSHFRPPDRLVETIPETAFDKASAILALTYAHEPSGLESYSLNRLYRRSLSSETQLLEPVFLALNVKGIDRRHADEIWLWVAASLGYRLVVDYILSKKKIEVDVMCADQTTPLWQACYRGSLQVVETLVLAGASTSIRSSCSITYLRDPSTAEKQRTPIELVTELHKDHPLFDNAIKWLNAPTVARAPRATMFNQESE